MFEKLRISGGGRPTPLHHQTVFVPVRMLGTLPRDEVTSPPSPHRVCRSTREESSSIRSTTHPVLAGFTGRTEELVSKLPFPAPVSANVGAVGTIEMLHPLPAERQCQM